MSWLTTDRAPMSRQSQLSLSVSLLLLLVVLQRAACVVIEPSLEIAPASRVTASPTVLPPPPPPPPRGPNWDREHSNYPPDLEVDGRERQFPNVSIFRILGHGCFDQDVTRFCGNRMTRFSCLYWIDTHAGDKTNSFKGGAKVEENLKRIGLDADFFENMDLSEGFGSIDINRGQHSNSPSLQPHQFNLSQLEAEMSLGAGAIDDGLVDTAGSGKQKADEEDSRQLDCTVYRGRVDLPDTWRLVFMVTLPAVLILAGLGNLLAAPVLARMGRRSLPLCYFTSAVCGLDCLLVAISAGDLWLRSIARVDATFMLLFACETCCQVYPMLYSLAAHLRQLCLVAMAIDTLALYQRLGAFYPKYSRERVFNCFVLFCALLLSLNCQFLWTYSLTRLDNPGEVNRGYHCGFSDKWVAVRYRAIIWPLIDLTLGDLIPAAVSAYCCLRIVHLCRAGNGQWLQRDCLQKVVFQPESFVQIRRTAFLSVALELPFSLPGTVFHLYKFASSASHMVQEHIFTPQSLRSLLGTQSHAGFLDRKNRQDLFFNVDSVNQLLLLAWLCARPLLHFACQATFRRCLLEMLTQLGRAVKHLPLFRKCSNSSINCARSSSANNTPMRRSCTTRHVELAVTKSTASNVVDPSRREPFMVSVRHV